MGGKWAVPQRATQKSHSKRRLLGMEGKLPSRNLEITDWAGLSWIASRPVRRVAVQARPNVCVLKCSINKLGRGLRPQPGRSAMPAAASRLLAPFSQMKFGHSPKGFALDTRSHPTACWARRRGPFRFAPMGYPHTPEAHEPAFFQLVERKPRGGRRPGAATAPVSLIPTERPAGRTRRGDWG